MGLKDWLLQQMRESSTWRGLVDIVVGITIEYWLAQVTFLSSELTVMMHTIALGFIARGGIGVGAKDTTVAGTAVKVAEAQAAVTQGSIVVPPSAKGVPPP